MTDPDRLYHDPELVQFYDLENKGGADFAFCSELAGDARSVLDLGCGTGQLAAALSAGRHVTGVDPAGAMLDVARRRAGGVAAEWIEADARTLRLDRRYDLVVLTGHAFQVFLTREDQLAVLRTIAHHLQPEGRFIFDTRNPAVREWEEWVPETSRRNFDHPVLGRIEAWNAIERDEATGVVTYETVYRALSDDRLFRASSRIAFPARENVAALIDEAGLCVDRWLGDWQGGPWRGDAPEIIPIGRLRG
ncbi:class I SAM-dependent methyltransferase [Mesorhizobium sp. 8]|uniref:class I SAM-dependent methyltransferase n=1 Tax=Mesorhizobium sp. 8 TaxID=2584466 RepID=UPI00111DEEEA|nr:class I SAM-dependent methyltransferase [Mesorhizobium sp. 8]QDC01248.1 class I SAM-dependent methyltransferase [Mesorhizobium sp. 8]